MNVKLFILILAFCATGNSSAKAEVTVADQNWKVQLGGFVEMDSIYDTTRSLAEIAGNSAIDQKGTFNGENGRTQFSVRNTRFSFRVTAPVVDGWATQGFLESDFLGYDPSPSTAAPKNSESSFSANPTLRIRHAFITSEKDGWTMLVGQSWSLFAWQPEYVLATVSVSPVVGTAYQRSARFGWVKKTRLGENHDLQSGISFQRPSQRDGTIPNIDLGFRFSCNDRKSGFSGANSDIKTHPASVALSGTYRNFKNGDIAAGPGGYSNTVSQAAYAIAADALFPILAASDGKDVSNTLTLAGEFTAGKGYGDEFTNWTGGVLQTMANGATNIAGSNTSIDAGLGGFNNTGNFELLKLRTYNAELQYHFEGKTFMTLGYGQIWSSNVSNFIGAVGVSNSGLYDRSESKFLNLVHDFNTAIRMAVEFDQFNTHYAFDGAVAHDNRYMLATYFRF